LLIVDNASTDGTQEFIQRLAATESRLTVYRENKIGGTVARNAAITKARGQYVLFLDDDAVADPGWLNAYRQFLAAPPSERIAAVGGAHFPEYEISPPRWIGTERNKIDLWSLPTRFPLGESAGECNCAFLRSVVIQVGMFDERLGHTGKRSGTGEGPDLHLRLQNEGWEIWWLPGAIVRDFFPANRLSLKYAMNAALNNGRSTAIRRLKRCRNRMSRMTYGAARIVIMPVHSLANILAGLFVLPLSRAKAADFFLRACYSCGLAWQLFIETYLGQPSS
jgi:glycosyltransferase involved in cell wall biosynthesis